MSTHSPQEDTDIGLDWVLTVVEGVDCTLVILLAMLFTCVLVRHTSQEIDKVWIVDDAGIFEAASALTLTWSGGAILDGVAKCQKFFTENIF